MSTEKEKLFDQMVKLLTEALPVIQGTEVNVYPASLSMRIVLALDAAKIA